MIQKLYKDVFYYIHIYHLHYYVYITSVLLLFIIYYLFILYFIIVYFILHMRQLFKKDCHLRLNLFDLPILFPYFSIHFDHGIIFVKQ